MSPPRPDPDDPDPLLEARVEHAVAPYAGLLPDEDLEALRDLTRCFLTTHPAASRLLDRLRPRAVPDASGESPKRDAGALAAAAERLAAKGRKAAGGGNGGAA